VAELGSKALVLALCQAILTTGIVASGLLVLFYTGILKVAHPLPVSILLGAIASATAPAATFMVVREYKARGPLTRYLLMAVTFDDAIGIILFDISIVIAKASLMGEGFGFGELILAPLSEIGYSLVSGIGLGLILSYALKHIKSREGTLITTVSFILVTAGLSRQFNFSPLLSSMALGATVANLAKNENKIFGYIDEWTPPIFLIFFVIAGANLDIALLPAVGLIGVAYALLRAAGKIYGSRIGAHLVKAPKNVQKYLGYAMLPQAGVAIGFAMLINEMFPELSYITTIVLAIVIIFEIIGPIAAKCALSASGDIKSDKKKQKSAL